MRQILFDCALRVRANRITQVQVLTYLHISTLWILNFAFWILNSEFGIWNFELLERETSFILLLAMGYHEPSRAEPSRSTMISFKTAAKCQRQRVTRVYQVSMKSVAWLIGSYHWLFIFNFPNLVVGDGLPFPARYCYLPYIYIILHYILYYIILYHIWGIGSCVGTFDSGWRFFFYFHRSTFINIDT